MTQSIYQKFAETNNWLMCAIIEKVYGRALNRDEILRHVTVEHDSNTLTNTVKLDNQIILLSHLKVSTGWDENGERVNESCHGYFKVPDIFMDEFIKERSENWMK
jgi:hypothetical protein